MNELRDWDAIRADFESGVSLRALAKQYGVSKTQLIRKRDESRWIARTTDHGPEKDTQGVINRDANAAMRVALAIKLRQAGWSYERVAAQCGYASPGAARNGVMRELDRVVVQNVEEWRNEHTSRLEKLYELVYPLAVNPAEKGRLFAVDRLLAILEREAKMLGLDVKPEEASGAQVIIEEVSKEYLAEGPQA